MPPFRPLFRSANIGKKKVCLLYDSNLVRRNTFKSTLRMTVKEISKFEQSARDLTLPDLPEEYLEVILHDNEGVEVEEFEESYPLAISDVTTENIINYKKLTEGDNVKETYLIELSTRFKGFNPGDTIGIITQNKEEDVQKLFSHLRITDFATKSCSVQEKVVPSKKNQCKPAFVNKITTLRHIFKHCLDIYCIPKKSLIRILSEFTKDPDEKRQLEELCSKEKAELYTTKILEKNKTFLDLISMYPTCCPPVARVIENLPKLLPRPYSIASSPLVSPNTVKILFSVIKNECDGIVREGLCTGMLKQITSSEDKRVKMFFRKCNGFNLPETNVPLIFVGPGTGIAPFIGFLDHRQKQNIRGIIWLFYGCRLKTGDYLFKEELQKYQETGVLTKLCVAFSRESDSHAKYVQDNIKLHRNEICELIFEKGAIIYVCGDAKNMRKDIQNSFTEAFESCKGMTNKEAADYIKKLQKEKRYLQDIWN